MTLFRSEKAQIPDSERLESALRELNSRVDTIESASRSLKMEFIELYEKTARLMSRMAKRYQLDNRDETPQLDPEPPGDDGNSVDTISASILRRRAGNAGVR